MVSWLVVLMAASWALLTVASMDGSMAGCWVVPWAQMRAVRRAWRWVDVMGPAWVASMDVQKGKPMVDSMDD